MTPMRDVALVVSADHAAAGTKAEVLTGATMPEYVSLSSAMALAKRGAPPINRFTVISDAEEDIGFCVAVAVVAAVRPRLVDLYQPGGRKVWNGTTAQFLAKNSVLALGQAAASLTALGAQSVAARVPRHRAPVTSGELRKLLYLRPVVGTSAPVGGAVTHTHEVIHALARTGVQVRAMTTDPGLAAASGTDGLPISWEVKRCATLLRGLPASAGFAADLALFRSGLRTAQSSDVLYQRHSRFSLAGTLLAAASGTPYFLEYNGPEDYIGEHWQRTPLLKRLAKLEAASLNSADVIFVVSAVMREYLVERGYAGERIVVNPNGVDPDRFDVGGGTEIRRRHGIDMDLKVIGFVGSFGLWHGAPVLARAFAGLAARRSDVCLLLVGDGPEKREVKDIIEAAGVTSQMIDVGRVASQSVPAYLDACDILASPHCPIPGGQRFFGSPTKLFEYMASGRSIVASSLEQIADVLDHWESALLVTPGNDRELRAAIERLLDDPDLRVRLGERASAVARERHTWDRNAAIIRRAFDGLVADQPDRPERRSHGGQWIMETP